MALYTRFGDRLELVRLATIEDVKTFERRKVDKQDRERTRDGWRAIARYCASKCGFEHANNCGDENVDKETLVDAGYLRADGGWKEIADAFRALQPKTEKAI